LLCDILMVLVEGQVWSLLSSGVDPSWFSTN